MLVVLREQGKHHPKIIERYTRIEVTRRAELFYSQSLGISPSPNRLLGFLDMR
jgi:hypothetical protein